MTHARQQGFTLIELAVVVTIASALMVTITMAMNVYYKRMQTQLVGKQYQLVNAAVGEYLGVHYQALSALPADCADIALALEMSLAVADSIQKMACALSLSWGETKVDVANGLQPSLAELKALHFLDGHTSSDLMLPSLSVVAAPLNHLPSATPAAKSLAVQITKFCPTASCTTGVQLSSLVFNTQPYELRSDSLKRFGFDLVDELLLAAGPDAAYAHATGESSSELHAAQDLYVQRNPIRQYTSSKTMSLGVPGILAVRNGFGSTTLAQFARRDGTSKVTGSWDFDGHPITGLSSVSSTGMSSVRSSTTNLEVSELARVQALNAQRLQAQSITTRQLKLPEVQADTSCDPAWESMGLSVADNQLLLCITDTQKWTAAHL